MLFFSKTPTPFRSKSGARRPAKTENLQDLRLQFLHPHTDNVLLWNGPRFSMSRLWSELRCPGPALLSSVWSVSHSVRSPSKSEVLTRVLTPLPPTARVGHFSSYTLFHCLSNDLYTICILKTSRHLQFYSHTLAKSTRIDEKVKNKKIIINEKYVSTTRGVPRRSPIQVLTTPDAAWLQWSDENWYFQRGMAVDNRLC